MSSEAAAVPPFPRGVLFGAAGLMVLTIVSAGTARLTGARQERPASATVMTRDLRFEDRADGAVSVVDARSGQVADVLAPGSNGFIRASLRSLAKRRVLEGDTSQVFRLTAYADGRLTLDDPSGGNPIELEAFGQTNEAAFARLLTAGAPAP